MFASSIFWSLPLRHLFVLKPQTPKLLIMHIKGFDSNCDSVPFKLKKQFSYGIFKTFPPNIHKMGRGFYGLYGMYCWLLFELSIASFVMFLMMRKLRSCKLSNLCTTSSKDMRNWNISYYVYLNFTIEGKTSAVKIIFACLIIETLCLQKLLNIQSIFGVIQNLLRPFFTTYLPQIIVDNLYRKCRQKWALFGPPTHLILSTTPFGNAKTFWTWFRR